MDIGLVYSEDIIDYIINDTTKIDSNLNVVETAKMEDFLSTAFFVPVQELAAEHFDFDADTLILIVTFY